MGNLETRPDPKEYGINLEELDIDEAYVVYDSSLPFDTWIYSLTNECVEVSIYKLFFFNLIILIVSTVSFYSYKT